MIVCSTELIVILKNDTCTLGQSKLIHYFPFPPAAALFIMHTFIHYWWCCRSHEQPTVMNCWSPVFDDWFQMASMIVNLRLATLYQPNVRCCRGRSFLWQMKSICSSISSGLIHAHYSADSCDSTESVVIAVFLYPLCSEPLVMTNE